MPFQSEAQRRYLWMHHPELAEKWAHEFPGQHDLPYHKGQKCPHCGEVHEKAEKTMKRTQSVPLDQEFEYVGEVVKSYVDEATGKRYIVGAATGLEEDQDGERLSKRAIANMVNAINKGDVKVVAGTHDQNWLTEIGCAREAHVDPQTDQLMVRTELPPEGVDAIADKAWSETHKRKMAWSIGGKLRSAYHELTEDARKRKVLDLVDLRHLCLTDKPAYQHSFAHAVAKTWEGDEPADEQFTLEVEKEASVGHPGVERVKTAIRHPEDSRLYVSEHHYNDAHHAFRKGPHALGKGDWQYVKSEHEASVRKHLGDLPSWPGEYVEAHKTTDDTDLVKDTTTGSWVPGGGGNSGQDSQTGGKRNAGTRKPGQKGMSVDDDGKDEPEDDDDEETVEPDARHMSCPQCGHEFAADIPVDMTPEERAEADKRKQELEDSTPGDGSGSGSKPDEGKPEEGKPDESGPASGAPGDDKPQQDEDEEEGKKKPKPKFGKSEEAQMDLEKRVEELEARLAKEADEAKRQGAVDVAKDRISPDVLKLATDSGVDPDVLKVVALATGDIDERLEKTREESKEGFELIAKAVMEMREAIGNLPTGRKSTARVLKRGLEDDTQNDVEKEIEAAETPADVLKVLNRETYGIQ